MNRLRKIDTYYIVTLLFLILTANASFISVNKIYYGAVTAFILLIAINKRLISLKDIKNFALFVFAYMAYVVTRDIFINKLDAEYISTDALFILKAGLLTFIFCTILKEKAAYYLVKVTYNLTVLSFVLFFIQLVLPNQLYNIFVTLSPPTGQEFVSGYSNLILFTFTRGLHSYQDSGFAWEPGSFGCMLIVILLLNLFLNDFKIDKKARVFIFAIIITFSTTTYLALLITLFLTYRYRVKKLNVGVVLLLLAALSLVITVPLLADKVKDVYYQDIDDLRGINALDAFYRHHSTAPIPLNRFSSMLYIYRSFDYNLIWGVTIDYIKVAKGRYNVSISNGIFDFLARFGLIGLIFLLYKYASFCYKYVKNAENVVYCVLLLLILGFGECIYTLPFFLLFLFLQHQKIIVVDMSIGRNKKRLNAPLFTK
jgi:hypothetical protein